MRFLPVFKYRMRDCVYSMLIIIAVMIALTLLVQVGIVSFGTFSTDENGFEATSTMNFTLPYVIFMFVLGIVTVREDMRIGIQNGASRNTSFLSNVAAMVVTSLLLSVSCIIFYTVWNALDTGVIMIDFYAMMFLGNNSITTAGDMLMSAVMTFLFSLSFAAIGSFLSLMYWRLGKIGKWVVSIGIGAAFILLINVGVSFDGIGDAIARFCRYIVSAPWHLNGFFAVLAVAFFVFGRLLVRRNNITAAI